MKYLITLTLNLVNMERPLVPNIDTFECESFTILPADRVLIVRNEKADKTLTDLGLKSGGDRIIDWRNQFFKSIDIRDEDNNILFFWRRKERK